MKQIVSVLAIMLFAQAQTFTHNRFTENGKTFSQDGTTLMTDCMTRIEPSETAAHNGYMETMLCNGYVEGVADFLSDSTICIPPEIAEKELVDVVVRYAAKHENKMHSPASRIIAEALGEKYSCSAKH